MTHPDDENDPTISDEATPMPDSLFGEEPKNPGVTELVRRALLAGVGAVFMTEEGIRKSVTELKLPKEAFSYLAGQAEKTRSEAGRILRKEIRRFLNSEAFRDQIGQFVSGLTLEIKAEVRLKPDDKKKPEGDVKVRIKPSSRAESKD